MNTTLEEIDRWQAAPLDVETLARIVHATSPAAGAVTTACTDVRREDGELVIELEVHLPVQEPAEHHIPGFHADVTGC